MRKDRDIISFRNIRDMILLKIVGRLSMGIVIIVMFGWLGLVTIAIKFIKISKKE